MQIDAMENSWWKWMVFIFTILILPHYITYIIRRANSELQQLQLIDLIFCLKKKELSHLTNQEAQKSTDIFCPWGTSSPFFCVSWSLFYQLFLATTTPSFSCDVNVKNFKLSRKRYIYLKNVDPFLGNIAEPHKKRKYELGKLFPVQMVGGFDLQQKKPLVWFKEIRVTVRLLCDSR